MKIPSPRPQLLSVPQHDHGTIADLELSQMGFDPTDLLDFGATVNPFGPSPAVRRAVARTPLDRLPDRDGWVLRREVADRLNLLPDQVLIGNGISELIWLIALTFVRPADAVLILGPTFAAYERAMRLMGADVEVWRALPGQLIFQNPAFRLQALQPRLVFCCNPNNPTGATLPTDTIAAWADAYPQTLFVVDEAHIAYAPALKSALTLERPNVLVLRSMTKVYGLAGLRVGFALGHEEVLAALDLARPPWSVSAVAQAAAVAALRDEAHVTISLEKLRQAKPALIKGLEELDLAPLSSATHFFIVRTPEGTAADFRRALLRHRIHVLDCAPFGLGQYVRITTRTATDNEELLAAVAAVVGM